MLAVAALVLSVLTGGAGVWLLEHWPAGAPPMLSLAVMLVTAFLGLVARAVKRDKAIQFWLERRELRRNLTREKAHQLFLVKALNRIHQTERGSDQIQVTLAGIVTEAYEALDASYDDIAVVMALEADRRHKILHSACSPGSQWNALRPGKNCLADKPLEATLSELSEHYFAISVDTAAGQLRLAVLTDVSLGKRDKEFIGQLPVYLELIAGRWGASERPLTLGIAPVR